MTGYTIVMTTNQAVCSISSSSNYFLIIEPARDGYASKPRSSRRDRDDYEDRRSPIRDQDRERQLPPAKIRVDNLHYDLTEDDIYELFTRIANVKDVRLQFDRAGRSEGTAFVTYENISDARAAVKEFDGANAKGQPIRLTILPLPPRSAPRKENPFDRAENPRSLFDRIEAPGGRGRRRSESPVDGDRDYSRNSSRRDVRGPQRDRRSDTTRPPPENIDRYIPGQGGRGGRRPGERRERPPRDGAPRSGARPKKTAAELDAEMDDYWGGDAKTENNQPAQNAPADGDIDMVE